ncbi:MAG TPA: hypothetical protein VFJ14_12310 [Nocardioidaceae bacterium]|nr:hypothetical protein [Nocardioidaceae bacterium]
MLITNHVLSGALVGAVAGSPGTAAVSGVLSHVALDLVPHFGVEEDDLMRLAVPDGLIGLAAIALIALGTPPHRRLCVLAGIFGACAPDLDKPGRQFFDRSPFPVRFDRFHAAIQSESPRYLPVEVAAAVLCAIGLRHRLRRS